jgi:hypothetical protein
MKPKKTSKKQAKRKNRIVTKAEYEAEREADIAKTVKAVEKGDLTKGVTVPTGVKTAKKATKEPKAAAKRDTGERLGGVGATKPDRGKAAKRLSGLDAAAKVLAETSEPMSCKTIVEHIITNGLWQTKGLTPAATIYAAIIREIATKGAHARFRKVGRGKFTRTAKKGQ